MIERLFIETDFRQHGLIASDIRGGIRRNREVWHLPDTAARRLGNFLTRNGFEPKQVIEVRESANPAGFVLTQGPA
jgi:hypothetical protein